MPLTGAIPVRGLARRQRAGSTKEIDRSGDQLIGRSVTTRVPRFGGEPAHNFAAPM